MRFNQEGRYLLHTNLVGEDPAKQRAVICFFFPMDPIPARLVGACQKAPQSRPSWRALSGELATR
jgi:hypothetical protein